MKNVFSFEKRLFFKLLYGGCLIACLTPLLIGRDYGALFFTIPFAIFLIWSWVRTGYTVSDGRLTVQNGPVKTIIPIEEIKTVKKTKNPLAAPALSIDRIEIIYGPNFSMALVSPTEGKQFALLLKAFNPQIELDEQLLLE